jgi:hypothetical protein
MIHKEAAVEIALNSEGVVNFQPLQKNVSEANLSRITATTAEGTDSFSIGGGGRGGGSCGGGREIYGDVNDDSRLTVFQIDSWSEEGGLNQDEKQHDILATSTSAKTRDDDIHLIISLSVASPASYSEEEDESVTSLPNGIPTEIFIFKNPIEASPASLLWSGDNNNSNNNNYNNRNIICDCDAEAQVELYRRLLRSFKHRLQTTSQEKRTLNDLLKQARADVEDLLNQRKELVKAMEEMEKDVTQYDDQQLLIKVIMLLSLLLYTNGGSPGFLLAALGLQFLATFINFVT